MVVNQFRVVVRQVVRAPGLDEGRLFPFRFLPEDFPHARLFRFAHDDRDTSFDDARFLGGDLLDGVA